MTFGVRWIWQSCVGPNKVKHEAGQKPSLCFRGRKYMICIIAAHPVRLVKRPVRDFDLSRQVIHEGKEYEVLDAAQRFKEIASRNGITMGASRLLDRALAQAVEIDEEQFNDEEDLSMVENVPELSETPESDLSDSKEGATLANSETGNTEATPSEKQEKTEGVASVGDDDMQTQSTASKANGKARPPRASAARKPKAEKVAKAPKAAKPAKVAKSKKEPKPSKPKSSAPRAGRRDFEGEILPFIVKHFEKIKEPHTPDNRPRGFAKDLYAAISEKFGCSLHTADQYFWKAVWNHSKALGIKGTKAPAKKK